MTRAALVQFVLAEIARSQRCPKGRRIRIEPRADQCWKITPLDQFLDEGGIKRIAAVEARFQVDFELADQRGRQLGRPGVVATMIAAIGYGPRPFYRFGYRRWSW